MPLFRGKNSSSIKNIERKANKRKKQKKTTKNEEGLGPSEVALWATSPDP